jgi:phenylalanyl-tRNA synthetase beta chain
MNISRRWLEDFLRRPLEAHDVAERLAMLGAPVDAIEPIHADLGEIVVALVEAVGPHPDADRLRLCLVNDGSAERKHVVCGAPNVTAGHRYPFIRVGGVLPGGLKIEKRKIRGQVSEGMLCSERELGLGQEHAGIWELTVDAAPGTPLLAVLPLADDRFVVDVTPNRPDLLGHKGVARELSASLGVPFRLPEIPGADALGLPPSRRADRSRQCPNKHRGPRRLCSLSWRRHSRREGRSLARMASATPGVGWRPQHQQCGGRHQLRHAGARAANPRV